MWQLHTTPNTRKCLANSAWFGCPAAGNLSHIGDLLVPPTAGSAHSRPVLRCLHMAASSQLQLSTSGVRFTPTSQTESATVITCSCKSSECRCDWRNDSQTLARITTAESASGYGTISEARSEMEQKSLRCHCHVKTPANRMDKTARNKLLLACVIALFFTIGEAAGIIHVATRWGEPERATHIAYVCMYVCMYVCIMYLLLRKP